MSLGPPLAGLPPLPAEVGAAVAAPPAPVGGVAWPPVVPPLALAVAISWVLAALAVATSELPAAPTCVRTAFAVAWKPVIPLPLPRPAQAMALNISTMNARKKGNFFLDIVSS